MAASGDPGRVFRRYWLKAIVGIEVFKLVDKIALFAVFFACEKRKILSLVHIIGYAPHFLSVKTEALPQLIERGFGNKAHRESAARARNEPAHAVGKAVLKAQRQEIVIFRVGVFWFFPHEQDAVLDAVFIAEELRPHENAQHRVVA